MNTAPVDLYGFPLLDNLHQLFPEILYDSTLFPHEGADGFARMISWVRFRLAHLYPQTFNRARQHYVRTTENGRREDYDEWMWLRNGSRNVITPPRRPVMHTFPTMSPLQASLNTGYWGGERTPINAAHQDERMEEERPVERRILGTQAMNQIIQNTLIDELLVGLLVPRTRTGGTLWRFYDPVPVAPSPAEIAFGSRIMDSSQVAAETICTICQDNASPRDISGAVNPSNGWRVLTNCTHAFHKDCIDRWFEGHVVCPVCRADIRVSPNQQTNSGRSVAESAAESVLSSSDQ
jgi:hypothetical protein